MDILKEISKDRLIIMVTHNPSLAEKYSTRIINLMDGEVVSDSTPFNPSEQEVKVSGEKAQELNTDFILTAHHSDDQVETVLLKLLRGAGIEGLSGMQVRSGKILRPLLHLTREHLENYCALQNINYCYDSSNDDLHYTRNKIRRELLPYLEKNFNPAIKKAVVQSAGILQEDDDCLNQMAQEKFQAIANCTDEGVILNVRKWQEVPAALRKRILRQAYFLAGGKELGYRHTEALDVLCLRKTSGKYLQLPQKMQAFYQRGSLTIKYCLK